MCNTVPKVVAKLGHQELNGFTERQLIAAFQADGYGIQKAERHALMLKLSNAIIPAPGQDDVLLKDLLYISRYCPWHYQLYEDLLNSVEVSPVRIERDGRITRLV